jgi:TolB protein
MTGMAYDPVWSPDGGSIAYVTQENESDDIWLMNADGSKQRSLMRNDWEWDKHPSWSPDSTLIAFFSNRNGLKQIYVMDTNGKVLRNLSSVGWDEYDPIWIK